MRHFVALCTVTLTSSRALPCCGVGFALGENGRVPAKVVFSGQSDLVIWNQSTKTEHFVRTASFATDAESFDFIAPTPTKPDIEQVDRKVFRILEAYIPKPSLGVSMGGGAGSGGPPTKSMPPPVTVVQVKSVGSFEATTLKATDSRALQSWLKQRGYQFSPDQSVWLSHYVKKGWFLTAFKYVAEAEPLNSEAIRMSFKTPVPFCPYYVPASNLQGNYSPLRVFVITEGIIEATVGKSKAWQYDHNFVAPFRNSDRAPLVRSLNLKLQDLPQKGVVTIYDRGRFDPTQRDDLFFRPLTKPIDQLFSFFAPPPPEW